MSRERNWAFAGLGLELFAGLLMTVSPFLAVPIGLVGLGFILYGLAPNWCVSTYEPLRARYLRFLPEWPKSRQITSIGPDITKLRSEVKRLIDTLIDSGSPRDQRDSVYERVDRIKNSDHSVWLDNENLRLARKDFVHWCGVAQAWREQYGPTFRDTDDRDQTLHYLNDAADRLDAGLKGNPVRIKRPYIRSEGHDGAQK